MWVRVITDFDLFFFFLLLNVYLFALTFIIFICLFYIQIKVKTVVKAYHWEKISKSKIGETS